MRTRLMASSMISGAALAAVSVTGGAQAQTAPSPAPAQATNVQALVVTGSRIPQKNLTSVSPVTTVNNQTIKLQGTTNVEDLINNLPQAFADFGQFETNGASGTADGRPSRPRQCPHPGAGRRKARPGRRSGRSRGRPQLHPAGPDRPRGSPDRRRLGRVRFGRRGRGCELHHEAQLPSACRSTLEFSIGEHDNNNQQVRRANAFGNQSFGFPLIQPALGLGVDRRLVTR